MDGRQTILAAIQRRLHLWKLNRMAGRGAVLLRMGRYESALRLLDRVLARDPSHELAWTGRGLALSRLGRYRQAVHAYEEALKLSPQGEARSRLSILLKDARAHLKK